MYRRISLSLLEKDRLAFALSLLRLYKLRTDLSLPLLSSCSDEWTLDDEALFSYISSSSSLSTSVSSNSSEFSSPHAASLSSTQQLGVGRLLKQCPSLVSVFESCWNDEFSAAVTTYAKEEKILDSTIALLFESPSLTSLAFTLALFPLGVLNGILVVFRNISFLM